jgi:hypothetical protein
MFGMTRMLVRCLMAAVLIAAHVPLPAAPSKAGRHGGPMSCCAPKSCCAADHACKMGGGCGGGGVKGSGPGPRILAGGCGDETPRVTPLQLDPTVAAQGVSLMPTPSTLRRLPDFDARCNPLASPPLVPPPRA